MFENLKVDHDDLISKFQDANRSRNDIEIQLKDENQVCKELRRDITARDNIINDLRVEVEKHEFKINALERDIDNKDIKLKSQEKQQMTKLNQLNDKINQIQQLLQTEKQNKELWVSKFEREQKENTENSNKLLNIQSTIKDKELQIKDAKIKYDALKRQMEYIQELNTQIQEKLNESLTHSENLERDLNTKTMMLENTEREKQRLTEEYKRGIEEIKEELRDQIDQMGMTLEDYLAIGQVLHKRIEAKDLIIQKKDETIADLSQQIDHLEAQITAQIKLRDENRQRYEQTRMLLDEQKTLHHHFRKELSRALHDNKNLMTSLNLKITNLNETMIERNKARANVSRLKGLLKKTEAEGKMNRIKILELKQEVGKLTEENTLLTKDGNLTINSSSKLNFT